MFIGRYRFLGICSYDQYHYPKDTDSERSRDRLIVALEIPPRLVIISEINASSYL